MNEVINCAIAVYLNTVCNNCICLGADIVDFKLFCAGVCLFVICEIILPYLEKSWMYCLSFSGLWRIYQKDFSNTSKWSVMCR